MSNFPRMDQSKKDREYHVSWAKAIATSAITDNWAMKYRIKQECTKFFNSGSTGDMASFLQKAQDGSDLPAMWFSVSSLKSKIENLIGELESRGHEIRVRALSKEAVSRKHEEKESLRIKRRLQDVARFAEERSGLPLQSPDIPQTDRELDEWADLRYKDKLELVYDMGLKDITKLNDIDEKRKSTFRDIWINNGCFVRGEIVNGKPVFEPVNSLCFGFDPNATDDMLSDSTYFFEVYYMGLAHAAERYNLSEEELEQAQGQYTQFMGLSAGQYQGSTSDNFFGCIPNKTVGWFNNVDGVPRVMVIKTCWKDTRVTRYKHEKKEKYNTEYLQKLKEGEKAPKNSTEMAEKLQVWRGCTLIGGTIVREWGELPNQPRDIETFEKTLPPYTCWVPNYLMGQSVSKVEQVVSLELLRDMTMYNLQLAMNRAGAKGFVYDAALFPEGWNIDKVTAQLKTSGIIVVNTAEYQMLQGGMNVLKEIDLSIAAGVRQYIEIMDFLDIQENIILGSSAERQGVIPTASQAVGVTDAAIFQSTMTTKPYFSGFERFWSRVLTRQAKLLRICIGNNPEMWEPIIGSAGVDFIQDNIQIDLESVGVVVESLPPLLQDRNKFEGFINLAVQSQQLEMTDALDIVLEPDIRQAVRRLKRKTAIRHLLEAHQAKMEQERDAALEQRLAAIDAQKQQAAQGSQLSLQQLKNKGSLDKTALTGRVKLNEKKIEALSNFGG